MVGGHLRALSIVQGKRFHGRGFLADPRHFVVRPGLERRGKARDCLRRVPPSAVRKTQRIPGSGVVPVRGHHVPQHGDCIRVAGSLEIDSAEQYLRPIEPWLQREGDLGSLLGRGKIAPRRIPRGRRQLNPRVRRVTLQSKLVVAAGASEVAGLVVQNSQ